MDVAGLLTAWQAGGRRGGWKPFLHHISKGKPQARRVIALKAPVKLPRVVTAGEIQAILDACGHLRDRLLFALLWDCGLRVGEALGLRHEDIMAAERTVTVVPRINDNRARSKSGQQRTVPVSDQVIRLYGDYLFTEYGDLDSDHVFVNLFARPRGQAWTYAGVYDLVLRLEADRGQLRPALVQARLCHQGAAGWGADRGGIQAAWPLLDHHHAVRLRASDR